MTTIQVNITDKPKPTHTVVRFNGHITWEGQAAGLPKVVFAFVIVQNADRELINKVVEEQSFAFISRQVLFVQRDQGKVIDCRINAQDRMMVPFHSIAYMSVDLVNMTGELSEPDAEGVERLADGNVPLVQ